MNTYIKFLFILVLTTFGSHCYATRVYTTVAGSAYEKAIVGIVESDYSLNVVTYAYDNGQIGTYEISPLVISFESEIPSILLGDETTKFEGRALCVSEKQIQDIDYGFAGGWMYTRFLGWVYTLYYPYAYSVEDSEWLYVKEIDDDSYEIYHYSTQQWESRDLTSEFYSEFYSGAIL